MAIIDEHSDDHPLSYHLQAIALKLTPQPILNLIATIVAAYQHVIVFMQYLQYWRIQLRVYLASLDVRILLRRFVSWFLGVQLITVPTVSTRKRDKVETEQHFYDTSRGLCRLLVEGNLERLQEYLRLAPSLCCHAPTVQGWAPLHVAVLTEDPKLVSFILSQPGVEANVRCDADFEANPPPDEVIKTEFCKKPIIEGSKGASPLHYACMVANEDIIKLLLVAGASYMFSDELRRRPIEYFQLQPSTEPILKRFDNSFQVWLRKSYLLNLGTNVGRLQQSVTENDMPVFQAIVAARPEIVFEKMPNGWTVLHVAVIRKLRSFVTAILEQAQIAGNKAFVNEPDIWTGVENRFEFANDEFPHRSLFGATALHYACLTNNFEIIEDLLKAGANWRLVDTSGREPKAMFLEDSDEVLRSRFQALCDEQEKRAESEGTNTGWEAQGPGWGAAATPDAPPPPDGWPAATDNNTPMEKIIGEKIIGQKGPIRSVCSAIRLRENGWIDPDRPLVMLFLGSSGVGKTELAKQVALYTQGRSDPYGDGERASILDLEKNNGFIRVDMTEFQQSHTVANLFGSPKGYVGYDDGGFLSQKLQSNPRAVVLLDEVEKAHPDVLTVFLQVFGDGRLTDAKIGTVYCQDAVFIMTSNLAAKEIKENSPFLRKLIDETEDRPEEYLRFISGFNRRIYPVLKKAFKRDEFMGRINQTIVFLPLNDSEVQHVISNELVIWKDRASEKHDIRMSWASEVTQKLARSYDVNYGVRSVLNEVRKIAVQIVAEGHIRGDVKDGWLVYLTLNQVGDIVMKTMDPRGEIPQRRGCRYLLC